MAELVTSALTTGRHAAIEAGTGIGKTFAYLLPVLVAGRRAIISTGTRTLQDQLFARDLPSLGAVVGRPARVALLKGRSNYLCRHRLDVALHDGLRDATTLSALRALSSWAATSRSGDLTELEDFADDHALRATVTSTVDNCLGARCEFFDQCFVLEARREAQAADVVIVNHHLLLADLAIKEHGFGELLPGADVVIVDEAHQLPEIAQQFFGLALGTRELDGLGRDTYVEAQAAGSLAPVDAGLSALARNVVALRTAGAGLAPGGCRGPRRRPCCATGCTTRARRSRLCRRSSIRWRKRARGCATAQSVAPTPRRGSLDRHGRCQRGLALVRRDAARAHGPLDAARRRQGARRAHRSSGRRLGVRLRDARSRRRFRPLSRPHRHRRRVDSRAAESFRLWPQRARLCARRSAGPGDELYVEHWMAEVWPVVLAAGGGAFLLFTSYRALQRGERWLERQQLPGRMLVQGRGGRSELLNEFRADGNAVLLGTGSFWQGVDVRGPALRVVAIDKLPFAAPSDPLVQARVEAIRRAGGDAFTEFQLPQAVLALKQGVGRLIRDFDDRGLIVLGDPRLRSRNYGRTFLTSLPPMPLLERLDDALAFAATLAPAPPARAVAS